MSIVASCVASGIADTILKVIEAGEAQGLSADDILARVRKEAREIQAEAEAGYY
jgi:hypothetical protein